MSELKNKVVAEIKKIYDPEIPVNIYELGLIYKIEISNENLVAMTSLKFMIKTAIRMHKIVYVE